MTTVEGNRLDDPVPARSLHDVRRWLVDDDGWVWGLFLVSVVRYRAVTADDAFITMRVARNLLSGQGPVFNSGERVEAFTSPLHVVVSASLQWIGGDPAMLTHKLASFAFGTGYVIASRRLVRSVLSSRLDRLAADVAIMASVVVAVAAVDGMETALAAWLMVCLTRRFIGEDRWTAPWSTGGLAFACVLARPEAALAVGVLSVIDVFGLGRSNGMATASSGVLFRRGRYGLPVWVACAASMVILAALARLAYFGDVVPNTFRAKSLPIGQAVRSGLSYLRVNFAGSLGVTSAEVRWWVGSALGAFIVAGGVVGTLVVIRRRRQFLPLVVVVVCQLLFVLRSGGDMVSYGRFLASGWCQIMIIVVFGWSFLAARLRNAPRVPVGLSPVIAGSPLGLAIASVVLAWVAHPAPALWAIDDRAVLAAGAPAFAEAAELVDEAPKGATVAFGEMGLGPWRRPDLRFIDLRGLADRRIATAPGIDHSTSGVGEVDWRRADDPVVRYVLGRRPELVVVAQHVGSVGPLAAGYRVVGERQWDDVTLFAYLRRDLVARLDGTGSGP